VTVDIDFDNCKSPNSFKRRCDGRKSHSVDDEVG